jgi:hypothetical protein
VAGDAHLVSAADQCRRFGAATGRGRDADLYHFLQPPAASDLAIAATPVTATAAVLLLGLSTAPMYPLLVLTTAERTSAAVADRMIGFQAAASAPGAAVIPALIGLAMGVSVGAFAPAIAPLCLTAAFLHVAMQMRRRR